MVLVFDVTADQVLVNPDGGDEVSSCPQRFFFIQTVFALDLLLEPCRRLSLHSLHGVGDRIPWCGENTEVNVVVLNVQLDDFPVFPFADGLEYPSQFLLDDFLLQYLSSVLRRPNKVIF